MAYWDESYWTLVETRNVYNYPLHYPLSDREIEKLGDEGLEIARGRPIELIDRMGPFIIDKSPESHKGPFACAIDFLVPTGTGVLAASGGVVTALVDHHTQGGPSEDYAPYMNYITIAHMGGTEFSQYAHLAPGAGKQYGLHVGKSVNAGDKIGEVGMTGWTDRPHLHFMIFRSDSRPLHGTHHHTPADLDGIARMAREWPTSKYPFKSLRPRFSVD